jgi:hypothetical protein
MRLMNFSTEGFIGLTGAVLIMTGFPVLLFGDYFDPEKKPTATGLFAGFVTGLGLVCLLTAFSLVGSKLLWTAIAGP